MSEDQGPARHRADQTSGVSQASDVLAEVLQQVSSSAHVSSAFEQPHTVGDRTVIPVAEVVYGFGFGLGGGGAEASPDAPAGYGSGAGGGAGSRVRPVATIVIEPDRVYVQPIVDATQIALAALTAGALSLFWLTRLFRRGSEMEEAAAMRSPRKLARLLRGR